MGELYHTVNPLIRIKETELLTKELFQQLITAENFDKMSQLLHPTIYGKYLGAGFQHTFEESLNKELAQTFYELVELVPNPEIIWIYTMRYTFHNLKVLTKAEKIGEDYDHLFMSDGFYSIEELKQAIQTGYSATLPDNLLESIREVNNYFEESTILQGIDVIYDRRFLQEQRRLGEKIRSSELLEEIIAFIDLTNIITFARCLLQKRSHGFIDSVLSSAGSIEKEVFLALVSQGMDHFLQFVKSSNYGELLSPVLKENKLDFLQLDLLKDNYLMSLYQKGQTTAFGPLPLLAFMNAKEIEITNLRLIIVGRRSGFSKEEIQERMRQIDV